MFFCILISACATAACSTLPTHKSLEKRKPFRAVYFFLLTLSCCLFLSLFLCFSFFVFFYISFFHFLFHFFFVFFLFLSFSFFFLLCLFSLRFSFSLFLFLYLSFSFFSLFFFSSLLVLSCLLLMCSSRLVSKLPLVNTLQGSVVCLKMTRQTQISSVHVLKRLRWETRKEKNHFPSGNRFALFPTKMGKQFDVRSWMQKTKIRNWFQKNGSVNSICRYVVSKVSGFEHMCTIAFFLFWCKELPINDHVSSVFTLRTFLLYQFFEKY